MSGVTRYEWVNVSGDPARQNITPVSAPDGEWVEYADYAAVVAEREALTRQIRAVEAWCASSLTRSVYVPAGIPGDWRAMDTRGLRDITADSLPALGQALIEGGHVDGE